jgi:hypothetical protein
VFAGREADSTGLASALKRLLGAVGVLALVSLAAQVALRGWPTFGLATTGGAGGDAGGGSGGGVSAESVRTTAEAADQALGLPPGLLVFLGGLTVLLVILGARLVRDYRR